MIKARKGVESRGRRQSQQGRGQDNPLSQTPVAPAKVRPTMQWYTPSVAFPEVGYLRGQSAEPDGSGDGGGERGPRLDGAPWRHARTWPGHSNQRADTRNQPRAQAPVTGAGNKPPPTHTTNPYKANGLGSSIGMGVCRHSQGNSGNRTAPGLRQGDSVRPRRGFGQGSAAAALQIVPGRRVAPEAHLLSISFLIYKAMSLN